MYVSLCSLLDDASTHIFTLTILEDLDDLGTQFTSIHDMIAHVAAYYQQHRATWDEHMRVLRIHLRSPDCTLLPGVHDTTTSTATHITTADLCQLLHEGRTLASTLLHLLHLQHTHRSFRSMADLIRSVHEQHSHTLQPKRALMDQLNATSCRLFKHHTRVHAADAEQLFDTSRAHQEATIHAWYFQAAGYTFEDVAALVAAIKQAHVECLAPGKADKLALLTYLVYPHHAAQQQGHGHHLTPANGTSAAPSLPPLLPATAHITTRASLPTCHPVAR